MSPIYKRATFLPQRQNELLEIPAHMNVWTAFKFRESKAQGVQDSWGFPEKLADISWM